MLVYVDAIISVSHKAQEVMEEIQGTFKFKNDDIKKPETYLGAKLQEKTINGSKCWTMSSVDYIKAVKMLKRP